MQSESGVILSVVLLAALIVGSVGVVSFSSHVGVVVCLGAMCFVAVVLWDFVTTGEG